MPEYNIARREKSAAPWNENGRVFLDLLHDDAVEIIERLRETHADVQGRAFLIRLDHLIEQLGPKWDFKRDLVFDHLKASFERRFPEPNWCIRINDDSFLASIPTLGEHKGALSAAELWYSAGQFFVGDVSRVTPPLFEVLADDVDRLRLIPIDLNKYFDRAEARSFAQTLAPIPSPSPESQACAPQAVGTMTPIDGRSIGGIILSVSGRNLCVASAIEPVFEIKKLAMIGHRFEPVVTEAGTHYGLDARTLATLDWGDREQIDIANIEQGIKLLQMRPPEQRKMLMVIPAAFSTFASTKARGRLMPVISHAVREMGLKVLFELRHLAGVPPGRISEVVSLLKPYCMTSMGHAAPDSRSIATLRSCGLAGACIDFDRGKRDDVALLDYLSTLSAAARSSTGACMIQGFNNLHEVAIARQAGVSHASVKASALMTAKR